MKRKIIIMLIVTCALLAAAGCGNKGEQAGKEDPPVVDETLVVINGLEFHLDTQAEFEGAGYLAVSDFQEVRQPIYVQYSYLQQDSSNLLFFRIFFYKNQKFKYAINDLGLDKNIPLTEGKTENFEYSYYPQPRDDGGTIHFYFVERNGSTYVLHFVSRYDISDFEQKVLKSIRFAD
ncbi:MAG: hypothetical protein IKX74_07075 [Erysipelotrichaceae bacterium]|nr:hypothetical protein [Erysipelotrichaceae bacterium]MBR5049383.1 hypothetical protein [Erysipelotrichaceae bacterium]